MQGYTASDAMQTLESRARAWAESRVTDAGVLEHGRGTAGILSEIGADDAARAAAWLFGAPQELTLGEVRETFGDTVARLVDSMRTLRRLQELHRGQAPARRSREQAARAEALRRMLLALSVDVRVVLLRLASRLQTLRLAARERRAPPEDICRETLDLLAPLANRLGIAQFKWELEDLAFRFLEPDRYHEIARDLKETRRQRQAVIDTAIARLRDALGGQPAGVQISGRPKHIVSIIRKMQAKGLTLEQLHDLLAIRVLADSEAGCYHVLAKVHELWPAIPGEFDDYIRRPKPNGYRSLHTVVALDERRRLEVQIRTNAMHEAAEYGVASHWRYKEGSSGRREEAFDDRVAWVRQLLSWQREVGEALGVGSESSGLDEPVYALTPEGRVIALPPGSTPVDFAYHVHTDLGHVCRGARVDGHLVPLGTPLRSGQTVEIITARGAGPAGPSRDWLRADPAMLASPRARQKVRQWFARQDAEREHTEGRLQLERVLARSGASNVGHEALAGRLGFASAAQLYAAVARVEVGPRALERAVAPEAPVDPPAEVDLPDVPVRTRTRPAGADRGIVVAGVDAVLHQIARCCNPVPPEPITGYVTSGRGVSVHREDCRVLAGLRARAPERVVPAAWPSEAGESRDARYESRLVVRATQRPGLAGDLGEILARAQVPMVRSRTHRSGEEAVITLTVALHDADSLRNVLRRLAQVPGVSNVARQ